ncbi:MAG: hypothetical protein KME25_09250 [Symplocastrum torsivum CPER-KK1]|uniref:Uncharacterized protein n=1 Tax=Symplocastrum torsivum CPER-KK1 TaxID=450513 RepID=A0A951U9A4_9CYAN|nr:hypothetical protein [Symplocastrum torsivum CPER-KK1]
MYSDRLVSDRTLINFHQFRKASARGSAIAFFTTCYDMPKAVSLGATISA